MRERFDSIYSHGIIRAAVCIPVVARGRPGLQPGTHAGAGAAGVQGRTWRSRCSRSWASRPTRTTICSTRTRCWTRAGRRSRAGQGERRRWRRCWSSGAPLRFEAKLFNCAVVIYRGRVLGLVPKTYLPNYREYYEKRQFASSREAVSREVLFLGEQVPFGNDLIFEAGNVEGFRLHAEICEDVWTPIPPSTYAALAGATVLVEPLGQQHHHRQGRIPPQPVRLPVGQVHRRVSVFVRRAGRVHHRPGLGRACADLRERRPAGRVGALCRPRADDHGGH